MTKQEAVEEERLSAEISRIVTLYIATKYRGLSQHAKHLIVQLAGDLGPMIQNKDPYYAERPTIIEDKQHDLGELVKELEKQHVGKGKTMANAIVQELKDMLNFELNGIGPAPSDSLPRKV